MLDQMSARDEQLESMLAALRGFRLDLQMAEEAGFSHVAADARREIRRLQERITRRCEVMGLPVPRESGND